MCVLSLTRRACWQPFAWPAREFVRTKIVGKQVTFEIEDHVASIGKTFGNIFVNGENLAAMIVAAGWAKVRRCLATTILAPPTHLPAT